MQDQYYTFSMFSAQAWLARDIILDKISLPSKEDMIKDDQYWKKECDLVNGWKDAIIYQGKYTDDVNKMTDYPDIKTKEIDQLFIDWKENKLTKLGGLEYRNYAHKSVYTSTMAPVPKEKWYENYADGLEEWIINYKK